MVPSMNDAHHIKRWNTGEKDISKVCPWEKSEKNYTQMKKGLSIFQ
jgi:hypothetical protein